MSSLTLCFSSQSVHKTLPFDDKFSGSCRTKQKGKVDRHWITPIFGRILISHKFPRLQTMKLVFLLLSTSSMSFAISGIDRPPHAIEGEIKKYLKFKTINNKLWIQHSSPMFFFLPPRRAFARDKNFFSHRIRKIFSLRVAIVRPVRRTPTYVPMNKFWQWQKREREGELYISDTAGEAVCLFYRIVSHSTKGSPGGEGATTEYLMGN